MAQDNITKAVKLSFSSKSKKVSSALNLRQQSIKTHRDNDSLTAQSVTNNIDDLFNKKEEQQPIIPLIKHNEWKKPNTNPPPLESDDNTTKNKEDDLIKQQQQEALDIILNKDNNDQNESDETSIILAPTNNIKGAFNQILSNKVPGIEDVIDPKKRLDIDCAQRPDAPDMDEYDTMSIDTFGLAMLRGMGWNKNKPVGNQYGKNQLKVPKTIEITPRPKNLGFGATLTKKEADLMIKRKYKENKQRTKNEKKRIKQIQSFTEPPPKKKQKIDDEIAMKGGNGINGYHENDKYKKQRKRNRIKWVQNGLKVRCIKKDDAYFRKKGIVDDVIDGYRFCVRMDDDKLITLYEDEVETVIPKKGQFILILNGKNRNERGCILTKNKHQQYASVQLEDNLSIVKCDYDDICAI